MNLKILFLFLLFSAGMVAQQPEDYILWRENPLTWKDFKATPAPDSGFHASANTGVSYSWSAKIVGEEVDLLYTVNAFFYPGESWVREKNDLLLAHEQLHFDISELHARKLREALEAFEPQQHQDLKSSLRKLYEKIEVKRKAMQVQYDLETRHSENTEAQVLWQEKIALALKELEIFKATE